MSPQRRADKILNLRLSIERKGKEERGEQEPK